MLFTGPGMSYITLLLGFVRGVQLTGRQRVRNAATGFKVT